MSGSPLADRLVRVVSEAIEKIDERLSAAPEEFFSSSAYGAQGRAAVAAMARELAEEFAVEAQDYRRGGPASSQSVETFEYVAERLVELAVSVEKGE